MLRAQGVEPALVNAGAKRVESRGLLAAISIVFVFDGLAAEDGYRSELQPRLTNECRTR